MENRFSPVDKPASFSRVEKLLIDEIKRLSDAREKAERENEKLRLQLEEMTNDRDRFARKYHDSTVDVTYYRGKYESERAKNELPKGRAG